jgi:hydroxyacylglutathione hydrolase
MTQVIKPINSVGAICYLVENNGSYILIDAGLSIKCANLDRELENAGCKPGNLKLIILTHGDIPIRR